MVSLCGTVTIWNSVFNSLSHREARRAESKLLSFTLGSVLNWAQTNSDLDYVYLAIVFLSFVAILRIA